MARNGPTPSAPHWATAASRSRTRYAHWRIGPAPASGPGMNGGPIAGDPGTSWWHDRWVPQPASKPPPTKDEPRGREPVRRPVRRQPDPARPGPSPRGGPRRARRDGEGGG